MTSYELFLKKKPVCFKNARKIPQKIYWANLGINLGEERGRKPRKKKESELIKNCPKEIILGAVPARKRQPNIQNKGKLLQFLYSLSKKFKGCV